MALYDDPTEGGLDLDSLIANSPSSGNELLDQLNGVGGVLIDPVEEVEQQTIMESADADTRVRLRCLRGEDIQNRVYGPRDPSNIMSILHETDGVLFPYTPTISVGHTTNYQSLTLVHSNSDYQSYVNTPSVTLNVTGTFTVQNQREGRYVLACLHLFRTVSKMYFGEKDRATNMAGMPPPVMVFTGYGNYMFNNLPVLVRGHSYTLDDSADSVVIHTAGGVARLPSKLTVTLDLIVQQTPRQQRRDFSLDEFRTGALMRPNGNGTGWI